MPQNKKKKLAILGAPLDNQKAGIHIYTKGLADSLHQQADIPFDVILFRLKKTGDYPRFKTIVIPILSWIPGLMAFRMFFIIPLVCRWLKVDMVLEPAHFGPFNLPKKVKRITVIHDLTPILFPQWHTFQGWFLQRLFLPRICRQADLILTVSDHTKSDIVSHMNIHEDKIKRIYPGISERFRHISSRHQLDRLGIPQSYFLSVGTIEPRKNHILILEAYQTYREYTSGTEKLVFAGCKGWKYNQFLDELHRHPNSKDIIITGYLPEEALPELYSHAKAHIYASHYEGLGLPVLESTACKTRNLVAYNSSLIELHHPLVQYFNTAQELALLMTSCSAPTESDKNQASGLSQNFSWNSFTDTFIMTLRELAY